MTAPLPRELEDDLREFLATPRGRRVAWWIIRDLCLLMQSGMDVDLKYNLNELTAYRAGVRSVGCTLLGLLQRVDPRAYVLLLREEADGFEKKLIADAATPGRPSGDDP